MKTTSKCSGTIHGNGANKLVYKGVVKVWFIVKIERPWVTVDYREQDLCRICVKPVIFAVSCIFPRLEFVSYTYLFREKLPLKEMPQHRSGCT